MISLNLRISGRSRKFVTMNLYQKFEKCSHSIMQWYSIHANPRETKSGRGSRVCHAPPSPPPPPTPEYCFSEGRKMVHSVAFWI